MKVYKLILVLGLLVVISACEKNSTQPEGGTPERVSSTNYAPADGECLFILGQSDEAAMQNYIKEVKPAPYPAGFAFYTSLSDGAVQSDLPRYSAFLEQYPNSALQLAIWTGERRWGDPGYYLDDIVGGRYDQNIMDLAAMCNQLDRPIFIRFGYEFDGHHNSYPPNKYIAAYQYFVDMMRDQGVDNVEYVWHSWGVGAYYGHDEFPELYPELPAGQEVNQSLWYPGDEYVDWVAMSIFGIGWGDLRTNAVVQYLITFAQDHNKPVMLAETAAIKTSGQRNPNWVITDPQWFRQVFSLINENDAVKAFTYINVDWEARNSSSTWGDTRIESASASVKSYWHSQIHNLLHADEAFAR